MKILIVLPNDSLGGAEQYLKMIATYYKEETVNIYFFKTNNSKQWDDLESRCSLNFMTSKSEVLGLFKFFFLMLKTRPRYDRAFTSHIYANSLLGFLRKIKALKLNTLISRESTSIFLRYKGLKLWRYKLIYKLGYKQIDLLICQTHLMKSQLVEHFKSLSKHVNIQVIPNPIHLKAIHDKAKEANDDALYDFPFVVSAGRLIPEKGFDVLISAFAELKADYPDLRLVILGQGGLKQELIGLAKALKIQEHVIFPGHVSNVYGYIKAAKLCVVSSRIEGFPNVLLQMMTQNTNVVSTLCAGDIDKIPGLYTCPPNDAKALYNVMAKCIGTSNTDKRETFDSYLKKRDISSFLKSVNQFVS